MACVCNSSTVHSELQRSPHEHLSGFVVLKCLKVDPVTYRGDDLKPTNTYFSFS